MEHYGFWSLVPPLVAIVLAIITRKVHASLLAGIFAAGVVISGWGAFRYTYDTLLSVLQTPSSLMVILFTFIIGGLVRMFRLSGGVKGFIHFVEQLPWFNSPRGARMLSVLLGIVLFIESNITILVVGTVCRPLFERFQIAREKLAYFLDSTSSPVCLLIPLNAWGAYIVKLLSEQGVENEVTTFGLSLLFAFYPILALGLTFWVAYTDWEFGEMSNTKWAPLPETRSEQGFSEGEDDDAQELPPSLRNMIIPAAVLTIGMPIFLTITGQGDWKEGSGSQSVFYSVSLALLISVVLTVFSGRVRGIGKEIIDGALSMKGMAGIMWLAFGIGSSTKQLGTGYYVAELLETHFPLFLLGVILFLVGSFVSFSTGTSWGTFGILLPIAVAASEKLGVHSSFVIGATLSGGLFGDHCSPISDTTLMASLMSGSDHVDHVRTQLPYAFLAGGMAVILFLIFGFILT